MRSSDLDVAEAQVGADAADDDVDKEDAHAVADRVLVVAWCGVGLGVGLGLRIGFELG